MDDSNGVGANAAPSTLEFTRDLVKAYAPKFSPAELVQYSSTGLATESAEVLDLYKKAIGGVMPVNRARVVEELGDVLYSLALLIEEEHITLQEINERLATKLHKMYPRGYWSLEQYRQYRITMHQGELR